MNLDLLPASRSLLLHSSTGTAYHVVRRYCIYLVSTHADELAGSTVLHRLGITGHITNDTSRNLPHSNDLAQITTMGCR